MARREKLGAFIELDVDERVEQTDQARTRIVGAFRIGGMTLNAFDGDRALEAAAPTDTHRLAHGTRIAGFADQCNIGHLIVFTQPLHDLDGAVDGVTFFITRDQKADRAFRALLIKEARDGRDESGVAAFHISSTAAVKNTVFDGRRKRREFPRRLIAGRHDIGVTEITDMRTFGAEAGEDIVNRHTTFIKAQAVNFKTERDQRIGDHVKRTVIRRGDAAAPDEGLGEGDGINHGGAR